jgi:hypothetical protein
MSIWRSVSLLDQDKVQAASDRMTELLKQHAGEASAAIEADIQAVAKDHGESAGIISALRLTLSHIGDAMRRCLDNPDVKKMTGEPGASSFKENLQLHTLQRTLMECCANMVSLTSRTIAEGVAGSSILPIAAIGTIERTRDLLAQALANIGESKSEGSSMHCAEQCESEQSPLTATTAILIDTVVFILSQLSSMASRTALHASDVLLLLSQIAEILSIHQAPLAELWIHSQNLSHPGEHGQLTRSAKGVSAVVTASASIVSATGSDSALDSIGRRLDLQIEAQNILFDREEKDNETIGLNQMYQFMLEAMDEVLGMKLTKDDISKAVQDLGRGGFVLAQYHSERLGIALLYNPPNDSKREEKLHHQLAIIEKLGPDIDARTLPERFVHQAARLALAPPREGRTIFQLVKEKIAGKPLTGSANKLFNIMIEHTLHQVNGLGRAEAMKKRKTFTAKTASDLGLDIVAEGIAAVDSAATSASASSKPGGKK